MSSKQKALFKTPKQNFSEWYETILNVAEIVDKRYPVKGMPILRPYGFGLHDKIIRMVELEWDKQGIEKVQFPLLIPESFLTKEAEHIKGFNSEVFWVPMADETSNEEVNTQSSSMISKVWSYMYNMFYSTPVKQQCIQHLVNG